MRTILDGAVARTLMTGALLVFTSHCGAAASSAASEDVSALETATPSVPVALFHPAAASAGSSSAPYGLAFDSSRFVPQAYTDAPSGTGTYGVFLANAAGVTEWFATSGGAKAEAATGAPAMGSLGIEFSASLGKSGGTDSILGVSTATQVGDSTTFVEQVYEVSFPSDALRPSKVATLGGPLPLPLGAPAWPSVVAASDGYARLVIAGEGQCCPAGASCGGSGEPTYENYIYDYVPNGANTSGPAATGIADWDYALDASQKAPACGIGLAVDNAVTDQNLAGEVTFVLYADGSVQPWLTHTTVWAARSAWRVPGAVSIAAYDTHVVILDDQGNVFAADPYRTAAPTILYAAGGTSECGGKVHSLTFDVTASAEANVSAKAGSLILEMQDATAGNVPVVCSLAASLSGVL